MSRPSQKEQYNKVVKALEAVRLGNRLFIANKHLAADLLEFGIADSNTYWRVIEVFLQEILDADPVRCYAGGRPPARSYEPGYEKLELFAYTWDSPSLGMTLYLKFGIKRDWYCHLDCHESRPKST